MRNAYALLAHPFVETLGWTLLHFVWQGALVALAYACVALSLRRATANVRYAVACASMLLMLALPVATFFLLDSNAAATAFDRRAPEDAPAEPFGATGAPAKSAGAQARLDANFPVAPEDEGASAPLQRWAADRFTSALPWLVLAWLAGALGLTLRLFGGWVLTERLRREPALPLARDWRETLARLARQLRVSRPVRLCESALVEVPTVIGFLRPVILVPASALTGLSAPQLEALLAHELAHIRRHDYLVNLLQSVAEAVLFYHPAVWWLSGRVRVEREHACDDLAVRATGDVLVYARALTTLETLRGQKAGARTLAVAANGGILMQRIQRLIKAQPASAGRSPLLAGTAVMLVVLASVIACAQTFSLAQNKDARSSRGDVPAKTARAKRQVAITFVSLPAVQTFYNPRAEKDTRRLLATLGANQIRAVGFVNENQLYDEENGGRLDEERVRLLKLWLDAGHELGTQTRAHSNLYKTPLAEFQQDVIRGEEITGKLMSERGLQRPRYFSYPFLNVGANRETKEAAEAFLAARGYRIHQVTIDNMDWLFGRVYAQARRAEDEATMKRVADEYLPYMERMFEYYEELSRTTLGYELPQVLMLTANALNAHKMEDLVAMMKRRGYEFVTLEQALEDKAYRQQPANYVGPWGISWLERWALEKGQPLGGEPGLSPFMRQFDVSRGGMDYTKLYKVKN
ncbi:MAG TPA: M56 family metallopeptidase [Pyrinomonadaceae bacterium]|jgi:beta-lactamase regulating signal transducer with metallopeptidase domain/peptidoglycan/xylan/chitin deacetylase (PgdA/CDA1 family)